MIRLLKFQARFGFEVDPDAKQALLDCRSEILKSASPRILEELIRMLESGSSASFFKLMADHGLLEPIMPEISSFLEKPEGGEIYAFLKVIDETMVEPHHPHLSRPVLVSALIFPLLSERIKSRYLEREKFPHLGEIQEEALDLIHEIFSPFFRFPKRLKSDAASLLTSQYRLTPFDKKRQGRMRIPRTVDFEDALHFFELRAALEPGYKTLLEEWKKTWEAKKPLKEELPVKPRRRRRGGQRVRKA